LGNDISQRPGLFGRAIVNLTALHASAPMVASAHMSIVTAKVTGVKRINRLDRVLKVIPRD